MLETTVQMKDWWESNTCIPGNEIAWPHYLLFPKQNYNVMSPNFRIHCIFERFIYSQDRSAYFAAAN
jgi:hypothetical protein